MSCMGMATAGQNACGYGQVVHGAWEACGLQCSVKHLAGVSPAQAAERAAHAATHKSLQCRRVWGQAAGQVCSLSRCSIPLLCTRASRISLHRLPACGTRSAAQAG